MSAAAPPVAAPGTFRERVVARMTEMRVKMDPFRLFLFLLLIMTIARVHQHYRVVARLRPALLLVACAAVYAYLNPKALARGNVLRHWPARNMVVLGVLACLSVPFGISMGKAGLYIIEDYSKTLVLAFLLIVAVRTARDLYAFVWAYVVSSLILVYFSLFVFGLSRSSGSATARLSNLYTYDANDIGCVLLVGLALALLVLQTSKRAIGRIAALVTIVGIGATIARSGSRGTFVGLIVSAAALLLLLRTVSVGKRIGAVLAVAVGLMLWAPPGYWDQMRTISSFQEDYNWQTTNGRKQVAARGIGYMMQYPLFGLGISNFARAECEISEKARNHVAGTGLRCTAPHNSYVQAGAELGIPGLVAWLFLAIGGPIALLRLHRRVPAAWSRGDPEQRFLRDACLYFAVAFVGFDVSAFFVSFAWMDIIYIMAAFTAGLYAAVEAKLAERQGETPLAAPPPAPGTTRMRGGAAIDGRVLMRGRDR